MLIMKHFSFSLSGSKAYSGARFANLMIIILQFHHGTQQFVGLN